MLRTSTFLREKMEKQTRYALMGDLFKGKAFDKAKREKGEVDGDAIEGRGARRIKAINFLADEMNKMDHPTVWVWFPWRLNPEPPTPSMPTTRALMNVHGAVYQSLTPIQKKRHDEMYHGNMSAPPSRHTKHAAKHPFLDKVLTSLDGEAKGFPFWFKKYPTRRHAYSNRFSIPTEMMDGYSDEMKSALHARMMTAKEKLSAQKAVYAERYGKHDYDTTSLPIKCANLAINIREFRNHLLGNPHNNVYKGRLGGAESDLRKKMSVLRRTDFKAYWTLLRDHDVQDLIQPTNLVQYRWGAYWFHDWNNGLAIKSNVSDFMDPRGLNGCIETGRSRAEVARDLGLSYTRTLTDDQRKRLSLNSQYYERLAKFKAEQPDRARERDRVDFLKKFTGAYTILNRKACAVDFPSKYRNQVQNKITRWKSSRHGPM